MAHIIAGFKIDRNKFLGRGMFGSVYAAQHTRTETRVAAKEFYSKGIAQRETDVHILTGKHPNIIQMFHNEFVDNWLFLELCDLGDVQSYCEKNKPDIDLTMHIVHQCAVGLRHLHGLQTPIIHRDIKPGNILLKSGQPQFIVKITDFDASKVGEKDIDVETWMLNTDGGTLLYKAPEFWIKPRSYTIAVDIFALGLVMDALVHYGQGVTKALYPAIATRIESEHFNAIGEEMKTKGSTINLVKHVPGESRKHKLCKELVGKMTAFDFKRRVGLSEVITRLESETCDVGGSSASLSRDLETLSVSHGIDSGIGSADMGNRLYKDIKDKVKMARHPIIYTSPTGFSIELKWGFIIHEKVDIIVNTTTTDIDLQASPLKDCISSDELSKIRQECRSKAPLSLDLGEYVVTGSGEKNKYIYHGCVIDSSGKINVQDYFDLIKDFFEIADSMNCTKIAIPVLEMKSFSQSKINMEKEFAMELSKWYKSTLAEDSSLCKIHLSLVVTDNDRLHEIYTNVISSLNKQQLSRSGTVFPSRHNNPTLEAPPRSKSPTKHGTKANSGHAKTYGDFTFKYKNTQITIKEGDVTDEKVDCIVHGFWQTGVGFAGITLFDAVGKALVKKAGAGFEQECNRTLVPKDQMDMTSGFNLCNKVLHVEYSKYTEKGYPSWADFMRRCLGKAANVRGLNSIAFPPIGTAITNLDTIAQLQIDGLGQFIDTNPGSLKDIRFVVYNDARIIKSFRDAAVTLKTKQAAPPRGMSGGSSAGSNLIARESRLKRVMHSDKGVELEIIYGDFAKERVDAIVHATNASMQFIGKAGEAIQKAGGKTFEAKVSKAYFHGKKVVITDAGQLPCKKVLHLDLFAGKTSWFTETKIEKTTRMQVLIHECLAQANKEKLNSIAFPAIGTGKFGCDAKDIAERFKQAISQFILQTHKPTLKEIRIIIFDPSMVQMFIDVLKK